MKKHFNYEISFEQLNGRMPPTNTPCDKQPIIHFDSNVHVFWPSDQKFYTSLELKNFVKQDFFNHPLVQHLKPLIHRKPIQKQYLIRQFEDPLVMEKKREILKNLSWFASIKNKSNEFAKTLKFRLNQLSQQNYNQISKIIIELLTQKQKDEIITFIEELINIAANQNKFRQLYSQLMKEIIKNTNSYKLLDSYLNNFIYNQENYEDFQNSYNKDDEIVVLTKRKQNFIGKYKFIVHLYKDRVIKIYYINNSIIQLQNRLIFLLDNQHLQQFFTDEIVESILDIISTMKNDLFIKQYREDTQLEQDFITFLKQKEYGLWNKDQFCFSPKGIRILLCWIEKRVSSQRLKLLIGNLLEKIDNNWKNKKQNSKKKIDNSESSDSDIEELPLKQKPSIKLNVQNLDLINEEENDFSVQKQPTIKQIHSNLERIFLIKQTQDYYQEILKLYSSIKQSELIISFWNYYLKLITRITSDNTQKVEYAYQIYSKTNEDFIKELILQQIQIRLSEVIYDIIDSKFGVNFMINFLKPFIEQDIKQLQLFLQIEINEETQDFLVLLIPKLVSAQNIQIVENIEFLQNFLIANLLLNKDQYSKVMDNIK
ncbi:unnamed protein product [Paramecium primaurelia]|uniref:Uncharacterized protein n=1 Tax=Paramecium primaurelia TaxID=5886 RepID=A0A8S1NCA3_PARPR|nr:unnamed protein product [Paramecium primaurelia]